MRNEGQGAVAGADFDRICQTINEEAERLRENPLPLIPRIWDASGEGKKKYSGGHGITKAKAAIKRMPVVGGIAVRTYRRVRAGMLEGSIIGRCGRSVYYRLVGRRKEEAREFDRRLREAEKAVSGLLEDVREQKSFCREISGRTERLVLREIAKIKAELQAKPSRKSESRAESEMEGGTGDAYFSMDYFDFEEHFRGDREDIKKRQEIYVPYFEGCGRVADLGCGRGEFTELLSEKGIGVTGVDTYAPYVEYDKMLGLNVVLGDAVEYMRKQDSLDGIFLGQVIEHLPFAKVVEICSLAHEKLEEGRYLVMETINPMVLTVFAHAFYMDPSHEKPVHPLTLQHVVKKAGFREAEICFTEASRYPFCMPEINPGEAAYAEFNEAMRAMVNDIYGSQDYAVIARK